ncbi:gluconokinase [Roseivirga sp. BDSF3-8]|uniref:gluconokinase n=1 Tax=Roseivirga sp. BDSF3-8 TaxID=3241598 RepID=UPI0035325DB6
MADLKPIIVVMGVSGSGKSLIGEKVAEALDLPFEDADDYHSKENIEKMKAKTALTDKDRSTWLEALSKVLAGMETLDGAVLACSALKKSYRQQLESKMKGEMILVYLQGPFDLIFSRIDSRKGHFMKKELLQSQFDTLEEPPEDEAIIVSVDQTPDEIVEEVLSLLPVESPPVKEGRSD